jgi:hypothetical protein
MRVDIRGIIGTAFGAAGFGAGAGLVAVPFVLVTTDG